MEIPQQSTIVNNITEVNQSDLVQIFTSPIVIGAIILLGVIIIVLCFFKKEIAGFISKKATKLSVGGQKGFVLEGNTNYKKEEKGGEQAVPEPELKEEEKKEEKIEEPVTKEDWSKKMFFALFDREEDKAREAFAKVKELTEGEKQKKEEELNFLYFSHMFLGDTNAIKNIEKYLNDPEVKSLAYENLAQCYDNSKDYQKAIDMFLKALELCSTDEEKIRIIILLSQSYYDDTQKKEAFDVITNNIKNFEDRDFLSRLYQQLAYLYEKESDFENRAYCLEKALEFKPNDAKLLFSIGYSYSEKGLEGLALLHYKLGKGLGTQDPTLLNNLGVAYQKLHLPMKSTELYKLSFQNDQTLAGANLAYLYINAGFSEEAKKIIDEAKVKKDVHPNVGEALATLSKNMDEENKKEESVLKEAEKQKKFILGFSNAYFPKSEILTSISEKWKDKDNIEYVINLSENVLTILWQNGEEKYKISGSIVNKASRVEFYKFEYDWSYTDKKFKKKNDGLLYFSDDYQQINVMIYGVKDEAIFYSLKICNV